MTLVPDHPAARLFRQAQATYRKHFPFECWVADDTDKDVLRVEFRAMGTKMEMTLIRSAKESEQSWNAKLTREMARWFR